MVKIREAPAQSKLKDAISQLNRELQRLEVLENIGMISDVDKEKKTSIQSELASSLKALNKLEYHQRSQQKYRSQKRQKLQQMEKQLKEAGFDTQLVRPTVGRPSLEEAQPGLLEAIVQIVSSDGQADERRRSELIRSVKTLDQLQEALTNMNYKLSRSATYLRLIPRRHNSEEGKRHVKTVPVKLLRSQNSARRSHDDTHFCAALIRNIKEMVSLLGPKSALVISQDDKARIPLGLAVANKQAPILMKLEYRVELPDHDWVVAERHKLIPSVYAVLDVQEGKYGQAEAVTYSGPTFIRIRSGKHDSSTAYSHGKDFDDLMVEEKLNNFTTTDGQPKPVVVMISDGGPDENPRYRKTVQMMVDHFTKYDLDTIIVACFAPHQSASNPVERRMAPLSHDLAGIILPHDTFGSHLDAQLKTSDEELEKRNFKAAGGVLTSVWEDTIIDGYPVLVKYVDPSEESYCPNEKSAAWMEKHVMTCRYMTQVIKCDDPSCCKPFHSGIKQVLPNRFFPPPLLLQQKLHSICIASMGISNNTTHFGSFLLSVLMERKLTPPDANLQYFPFDWYCPTVNKSINEYLCSYCNRYYALKGALKIHTRKCKKSNLSKEPVLDIQDYEGSETMQVDEEAVPEDLFETYPHQVQVQEKLIADRVLIVDWDTWKQCEWANE
ncbi:7005_t:CDS:2 [Dentiscutata heterogama]|uniref:7005_t:CDS:1 n=1 Tax=Dentiscutata heterogama TaxID=1316150 RepID=A0ACA9LWC9_9GLOM|nr:7005_t:CDS:2 [Dentiscutata heterogama]